MDTLKPLMDTFKPNLFGMLSNNKGFIRINRSPDGDDGGGDGGDGSDGDAGDGRGYGGDGVSAGSGQAGAGDGGVTATKWYDGFSQELKDNPTVQKYKTNEEQVKAHLELQSVFGNEKVVIPKDANDKVAIEQFNKALGIPADANGYELDKLEDIKEFEGMDFGDDKFKELAFSHGLTPKQANGLRVDYVKMLQGIKQQSEAAYVETLTQAKQELTKEWGLKFDTNIKLAQSVINKFAKNEEEFKHINGLIGNDPASMRFLANIGSQFKEGSLGDLGTPSPGFTKTPAEAKLEYDEIMLNQKDVYWSGTNKEAPIVPESVRKERISYVESLLRMQQAGNA